MNALREGDIASGGGWNPGGAVGKEGESGLVAAREVFLSSHHVFLVCQTGEMRRIACITVTCHSKKPAVSLCKCTEVSESASVSELSAHTATATHSQEDGV